MAQVLHGDANGNQLNAAENRTQIYGLSGNDSLISNGKSDVLLIGGSGDDSLIMTGGNATLSGGEGSDTFELTYSADKKLSATIEDLDPTNDKIVVNFAGSAAPQLKTSTSGNDVILRDGELLNVTLKGVRDNDYFDGTLSDEAWEILKLTNDEREKKTASDNIKRPWLTLSDGLTAGASIRVQEVTEIDEQGVLDVYKHDRPNNLGGYSTVFNEVGKHYSAYAENITAGEPTATQAMKDWIGSASHNVNIWNPNYLKLGVGYNYFDNGSLSVQRHYWGQLFGGSLRATEKVTLSTADLLTAIPEVNTVTTAVTLTDNPDTYSNNQYGVTIAALSGADQITNSGAIVSISGGNDNDMLQNSGSFVTINGGAGNDSISLVSAAQGILIQYATGDGKDTVSGLNSTDTVSISGGEFTPVTVGNNIVVNVGDDSITLSGAARSNVQIVGSRSNFILGTQGADNLSNNRDGVTIQALGGNDTITNNGDNTSINAGAGNDSINSDGDNVVFFHESGNDTIGGFNATSTLQVAGGNYSSIVSGYDNLILIDSNSADSINLLGTYSLSINIVDAEGKPVTVGDPLNIVGTEGADKIISSDFVWTITALGGDDTITNISYNSTVDAGAGSDSVNNSGANVSISGGDGNDTIDNHAAQVSISGGAGDDYVNNNGQQRTTYIYESGNDTVEGFNDSDVLNIGGYSYDIIRSGNDILVNITDDAATVGTVMLKDYPADQHFNVVSNYNPTVPGEEISNDADAVSVIGTVGNDTIYNYGFNVTIASDAGNDYIYDNGLGTAYVYTGGNNTISGFRSCNTLVLGNSRIFSSLISNGELKINMNNGGSIILSEYAALGEEINIVSSLAEVEQVTRIDNSTNNTIITGTSGNDAISNNANNVTINASDGNNDVMNGAMDLDATVSAGHNVVINTGSGNDYIRNNHGTNVQINSGGGADIIYVAVASDVTVNMDAGNDVIWNDASNILINGGADNDFIGTSGGDYDPCENVTIDGGAGNDTINNYGVTGSSTNSGANASIFGGDGNDVVDNAGANATVDGGAGNDTVDNNATNVSIEGDTGNDHINNYGDTVTVNSGAGDDTVWNQSNSVTINSGDGNDWIFYGWNNDGSIDGGAGDDTIDNYGTNVTMEGGSGNDLIYSFGDFSEADGGAGNDYILNSSEHTTARGGDNVTINGDSGDDSILNDGDSVTIDSGDGNDYIKNGSPLHYVYINGGEGGSGDSVSINGGAGNDSIYNYRGTDVSIFGGAGNDEISLGSDSRNNFIRYADGDGNDTVWGMTENDTLNFLADASLVSSIGSGDDLIYNLGTGSILLIGARYKPPHITYGESGTEGGGSGRGDGGGSSSGSGGRGGNDGGKTSGGTSSNEGMNSDASGNKSAIGSRGRSNSTNTNAGGGRVTSTVSTANQFVDYTAQVRQTLNAVKPPTTTNVAATSTSEVNIPNLDFSSMTTVQVINRRVYSGGNQIISDYQSGEKIIFAEVYTGSFYDAEGNYCVGSSTGALVIQNSVDKVVDFIDVNGNDLLKAYAASTAGVIDGRGLGGFEVINGANGADAIFAGDGGSQLWGGYDVAADTLVGGGGTDIFIGGKNQGADVFLNASSADIVHLNDASLSDIVSTAENNGAIAIAFSTGNVVGVQSSEALSAKFILADGAAYQFNHANKSWQNA